MSPPLRGLLAIICHRGQIPSLRCCFLKRKTRKLILDMDYRLGIMLYTVKENEARYFVLVINNFVRVQGSLEPILHVVGGKTTVRPSLS
jgi:hypothetical protein